MFQNQTQTQKNDSAESEDEDQNQSEDYDEELEELVQDEMSSDEKFMQIYHRSINGKITINEYSEKYYFIQNNIRTYFCIVTDRPVMKNEPVQCWDCQTETNVFNIKRKRVYCLKCVS